MAKTAICMACGLEFPSEAAFEAHKASGHKTKGVQLVPPEGIPADAMPSPEFIETVRRMEAENANPEDKPVEYPERVIPEPKPIQLIYVYQGECTTCRKPVSTIELDVKDAHFVVAYCEICKKQLKEREEKDLK